MKDKDTSDSQQNLFPRKMQETITDSNRKKLWDLSIHDKNMMQSQDLKLNHSQSNKSQTANYKVETEVLQSLEDSMGQKWLDRYNELTKFAEEYGHCNVPQSYEKNKQLGYWIARQRYQYKRKKDGKKSHMTPGRIELLENLGFQWSPDEKFYCSWYERYNELVDFHKQKGHCNVEQSSNHDKQLKAWVSSQRYQYKRAREGKSSHLSSRHIILLDRIGLEWSPSEKLHNLWYQRYRELIEYKKRNGHCNVPQKAVHNKQLAAWVNTQRSCYKKLIIRKESSICKERFNLLEEIGFEWNPSEKFQAKWHERYEELVEFKKQYGHCNVPQRYKHNKQLAVWVKNQRYQYRKHRETKASPLSHVRIDLMNKLGFVWKM